MKHTQSRPSSIRPWSIAPLHLSPQEDKFHHSSTFYFHFNTAHSICRCGVYLMNKSTYIILQPGLSSICLSIYMVQYRVLPSSRLISHISDRLTHFSSFTLEQTVPGGEAGHDIRLLQSWLVQGFISMGSFASPSSLKSLQQQIADRGNGWVSFQCGASTCLITQGHIE